MLYITTRNKTDSFTSHWVLREQVPAQSGHFLPIRFPVSTPEEIAGLKDKNFSQTVAMYLNRFFSVNITGWDVELSVGKTPFKIKMLSKKVYIVNTWYNQRGSVAHLLSRLYSMACGAPHSGLVPSGWPAIAIQISLLFGYASELMRMDIAGWDISVAADDFDGTIAAWYARAMGLPVKNILCGCSKNSALWDLLHKGECATASITCPDGIERLIFSTLGFEQTQRFLDVSARKGIYKLDPDSLSLLNNGLSAAVIGQKRCYSVINSVFRTDSCLIDPDTAISYGALQDHRTRAGENSPTVLLCQTSPMVHSKTLCTAAGITEAQLQQYCLKG